MLGFESTLDRIVSHASALSVFDSVLPYESVGSSGNSVDCNVWLNDIETIPGGLDQTSVVMTFNVSIMSPLLSEPYEQTDKTMAAALDALMTAYNGDFTLGGTIRNVDILGQHSEGITVRAGYYVVDNTKYRLFMISLPLLIDGVWEQDE